MTGFRPLETAVGRAVLGALILAVSAIPTRAQPTAPIELTIERMVELGLRDSYRVQRLLLDIDRGRAQLRAEQAALKSRVDLNLATPDVAAVSDYKWNSTLQRNELIREDTQRWQMDLAVRQPVILFGYPTDGTLSLNNRIYRYAQRSPETDISFYNRYFVRYDQPLFQPNRMKQNLEEAELGLETSELGFQNDIVNMVSDLADDYFRLFDASYDRIVAASKVANLQLASAAASALIAQDSGRALEADQIAVAIANAQEDQQSAQSRLRLQGASLKQRLRLSPADSLVLNTDLTVTRVNVDVERAMHFASTLAPRMRFLAIDRRRNEVRLAQTEGNNSFRVNLELTYGREVEDPRFQNLWQEPRNSYTVSVDAYVPLWDWGQRRERIRAQEYQLQRTDLSIEQARSELENSVRNEISNLTEYEQRAENMQRNLATARQLTTTTIARYRTGDASLVDVLQTIDREAETANNLLDAYLGYRNAVLDLQRITFYDFERNQPLLERYRIGALARN